MASAGSVTHWVAELKAGNHEAAQKLWERYFEHLVRLARVKLQHAARRAADEEDVALSAFASFCCGAEQGRFPNVHDKDDLWRMLVVITARKARALLRHERSQKRGGGVVVQSPPGGQAPGEAEVEIEKIIGPEPTPDFAAQVAEEFQRLLDVLGDKELTSVAILKMEGYTNAEIADRLGRVPRTIDRRLGLIRKIWGQREKP
jgi:DNA-directed RNA polymerase specialized sigma24 family protein